MIFQIKERQVGDDIDMKLPIILGSVVLFVVLTIMTIFIVRKKTSQIKYDIEKVNESREESEKLNDHTNEKLLSGKNQ